jgi:hypothetical protein
MIDTPSFYYYYKLMLLHIYVFLGNTCSSLNDKCTCHFLFEAFLNMHSKHQIILMCPRPFFSFGVCDRLFLSHSPICATYRTTNTCDRRSVCRPFLGTENSAFLHKSFLLIHWIPKPRNQGLGM